MSYPKPKAVGGCLIREVIAFLKQHQVLLPLTKPILVAFSGGIDSTALAHLLIHFGRRIVPSSQISLLHINHGWRGEESDEDEAWAKAKAQQWGVPLLCHSLHQRDELSSLKVSWEDYARKARKAIFEQEAQKYQALIFTAHHADDLAETLLWRLFTGKWATHSQGILFRQKEEVRPLLTVRKKQLLDYLEENSLDYREDSTNQSLRFMRSRMRKTLMPEIEALFPRAVSHLVEIGTRKRKKDFNSKATSLPEEDKLSKKFLRET